MDALVKPELLAWARKSSGYDLSTAANKLKVPVQTLEDWENGKQKLSIPQLRKLAKLYKRPLAVFYLPEVPKTFDALHDYRRLPDEGVQKISPGLSLEIRKAELRRATALYLLELMGETPKGLELSVNPNDKFDEIAKQIRQFLGITIEQQLKWRDNYDALNSWKNAVEEHNILVFQTEGIPVEEMRGISIHGDILPVIVLNGQDAPTARIFSLIHEFTHIAIHQGGICDFRDTALPLFNNPVEVFCNQVAGEVLVPASALMRDDLIITKAFGEEWTDLDTGVIADRYKVSDEVILRRLVSIGAMTEEYYRRKREDYLKIYAKLREKKPEHKATGKSIPRFRLVIRNNGVRYTKLVLNAYYDDYINASDLSDYLDVRLKHLNDISEALFY